jgi:hypothetical protein
MSDINERITALERMFQRELKAIKDDLDQGIDTKSNNKDKSSNNITINIYNFSINKRKSPTRSYIEKLMSEVESTLKE